MTNDTTTDPGAFADQLIAAEVGRQDAMWGTSNERAAVSAGQLVMAADTHLVAVVSRREAPDLDPYKDPLTCSLYPKGWTGFRDYGSEVSNLAVAAAFVRNEMKRLIEGGASTYRRPRDTAKEPYGAGTTPLMQAT